MQRVDLSFPVLESLPSCERDLQRSNIDYQDTLALLAKWAWMCNVVFTIVEISWIICYMHMQMVFLRKTQEAHLSLATSRIHLTRLDQCYLLWPWQPCTFYDLPQQPHVSWWLKSEDCQTSTIATGQIQHVKPWVFLFVMLFNF